MEQGGGKGWVGEGTGIEQICASIVSRTTARISHFRVRQGSTGAQSFPLSPPHLITSPPHLTQHRSATHSNAPHTRITRAQHLLPSLFAHIRPPLSFPLAFAPTLPVLPLLVVTCSTPLPVMSHRANSSHPARGSRACLPSRTPLPYSPLLPPPAIPMQVRTLRWPSPLPPLARFRRLTRRHPHVLHCSPLFPLRGHRLLVFSPRRAAVLRQEGRARRPPSRLSAPQCRSPTPTRPTTCSALHHPLRTTPPATP